MTIEIRLIQTHDEYRGVERLQREAWSLEEVEIIPDHLLLTAQKNGGLVLGAFDVTSEGERERLVGFVFGFVGLSPDGRLKHCSHMTGVSPAYQNRGLGYRLKLAQREHVLALRLSPSVLLAHARDPDADRADAHGEARGISLITWTFDPLESRNARLNFHKLGATCHTYLPDLYGGMRDGLNVGLASDRFQVDWHIASDHVESRLRGVQAGPSLSALQAAGVPLLNGPRPAERDSTDLAEVSRRNLPQTILPIEGERLLLQVPPDFQAVKSADMDLARAWRLYTRALFEAAFAEGYTVTDLLFEGGESYYLLEKDWMP